MRECVASSRAKDDRQKERGGRSQVKRRFFKRTPTTDGRPKSTTIDACCGAESFSGSSTRVSRFAFQAIGLVVRF